MWPHSAWIWLTGVLAGWVFLRLLAGRFNAMRTRLDRGGGQRGSGRSRPAGRVS